MMITRLAGLLILLSQVLLLAVIWDTNGRHAILFSFVGHPLLGVGIVLGVVAVSRRLRSQGASASTPDQGQTVGD